MNLPGSCVSSPLLQYAKMSAKIGAVLIKKILMHSQNSDTKNAWIMGRKTFEQHFLSPEGIFKKFSHSVVKVVLTRSWSKLPEGWEDSQLTYICRNWDEVGILYFKKVCILRISSYTLLSTELKCFTWKGTSCTQFDISEI